MTAPPDRAARLPAQVVGGSQTTDHEAAPCRYSSTPGRLPAGWLQYRRARQARAVVRRGDRNPRCRSSDGRGGPAPQRRLAVGLANLGRRHRMERLALGPGESTLEQASHGRGQQVRRHRSVWSLADREDALAGSTPLHVTPSRRSAPSPAVGQPMPFPPSPHHRHGTHPLPHPRRHRFAPSPAWPRSATRIGMAKPLVVTDGGVKAAGVLASAMAPLADRACAVFDQTPSNPTEAAIAAAAARYQVELRRPDRRRGGLEHRPGQGRSHRRHAPRPTKDPRHHRRRQPEDHESPWRHSSPCRPRPAPAVKWPAARSHRRRWAQAGFYSWHLMPKAAIWTSTDARPAAGAHRRHRHGCHRALPPTHGTCRQPPADGIALRRSGAGWAHRARHAQWPGPRGAGHDECQHAGRHGVPEGPGLRIP